MPAAHLSAAIVSQGDEIVLGQTLDSNSRWLASRLFERGVVPLEHVSVPDDRERIARTILRLAGEVELIVVSGGLGPTPDDLTREALAQAMGSPLVEDPLALDQIEAWFAARGRPMQAINRVQAMRPRDAVSLENRFGTAPGIWGKVEVGRTSAGTIHAGDVVPGKRCDVFCLPGPPREMMPMFEEHVLPRLKRPPGRVVATRTLHTLGLGESEIAARLGRAPGGDLMRRGRQPSVGTTASGGVVSVRLRIEDAASEEQASTRLAQDEAIVRELLGDSVFADGNATVAATVVRLLQERGETVTLAESCTGGLVGKMLTDVPGSSRVFERGWVTYSNEAKAQLLGVAPALFEGPGAVSREVASAMAVGARSAARAAWGIGVTGIAGPDGATASKPVGSVFIAVAGPVGDADVRLFGLTGDREAIREQSAQIALSVLLLNLTGRRSVRLLREQR